MLFYRIRKDKNIINVYNAEFWICIDQIELWMQFYNDLLDEFEFAKILTSYQTLKIWMQNVIFVIFLFYLELDI